MDVKETLRYHLSKIGLNNSEILAYLTCYSYGVGLTSGTVARRANLKNSTTTMSLVGLVKQGILTSFLKGNSRYYLAEDPKKVIQVCINSKKKEIDAIKNSGQKIIENIEQIRVGEVKKPLIRIYEGENTICDFLQFLFEENNSIEISVCMSAGKNEKYMSFWKNILTIYTEKKNIKLIVNNSVYTRDFIQMLNIGKNIHIECVDSDTPFADKIVTNDYILQILWSGSSFSAIAFENVKHTESANT